MIGAEPAAADDCANSLEAGNCVNSNYSYENISYAENKIKYIIFSLY